MATIELPYIMLDNEGIVAYLADNNYSGITNEWPIVWCYGPHNAVYTVQAIEYRTFIVVSVNTDSKPSLHYIFPISHTSECAVIRVMNGLELTRAL